MRAILILTVLLSACSGPAYPAEDAAPEADAEECLAASGVFEVLVIPEEPNACVTRNIYWYEGMTIEAIIEEAEPCGIYWWTAAFVQGTYTYNLSWWVDAGPEGPTEGELTLTGTDLECLFSLVTS